MIFYKQGTTVFKSNYYINDPDNIPITESEYYKLLEEQNEGKDVEENDCKSNRATDN